MKNEKRSLESRGSAAGGFQGICRIKKQGNKEGLEKESVPEVQLSPDHLKRILKELNYGKHELTQ